MPKSLHIKRIAYGRQNTGRRVTYLLAASPDDGPRGIPEQVVLSRWRKRKLEGYSFQGARLKPSVWRALPDALGQDVDTWMALDLATLKVRIESWRERYKRRLSNHRKRKGERTSFQHLALPSAETVHALIQLCRPARLQLLVARHKEFSETRQSGVPDLFLYTRATNGTYAAARFVEVKKPKEPVSSAQNEEIAFLRSLRLEAFAFRLAERASSRRGFEKLVEA